MSTICKTSGLDYTMPASLIQIDYVCGELKVFLERQHHGSLFFELSLMLREALANAVVHGCQMNESLEIQIRIQCDEHGVTMEVEDPGDGFNWQERQGLDSEVWQDHGRGMLIFRCYATDVTYNDNGNRITLRKSF